MTVHWEGRFIPYDDIPNKSWLAACKPSSASRLLVLPDVSFPTDRIVCQIFVILLNGDLDSWGRALSSSH